MRGGALPPALLCAALGIALGFGPRRLFAPSLAMFVAAAFAASLLRAPTSWDDAVFLGCWVSLIIAAGSVHLPPTARRRWGMMMAANAGLWTGAVIAVSGSRLDLFVALPWALLCIPVGMIVARKRGIIVKVIASWLMAVGILAASLQMAPTTPGYRPDHMD